ncbi:MAG: metal-dependent transcriptional regulator [Promethearchaeota archaeon]
MESIKESQEDYLKAIYLISKSKKGGWVNNSQIARFLNVQPPSVSEMLHKLKAKGLIDWSPRRAIRLTRKGKLLAMDTLKKYEILKDFFLNVLKIEDEALINQSCCKIEHHLTLDVLEALRDVSP